MEHNNNNTARILRWLDSSGPPDPETRRRDTLTDPTFTRRDDQLPTLCYPVHTYLDNTLHLLILPNCKLSLSLIVSSLFILYNSASQYYLLSNTSL